MIGMLEINMIQRGQRGDAYLHRKSGVGKRCFNSKSIVDVVWDHDTFPSPVLDLLGAGVGKHVSSFS
jgi:hypothetical protein